MLTLVGLGQQRTPPNEGWSYTFLPTVASPEETRGIDVRSLLSALVQKQETYLAMCSCPLSLRERARVRVPWPCSGKKSPFGATVWAQGAQRPSPQPSP